MKTPQKTISTKAIKYWRILDSITYSFIIVIFIGLIFSSFLFDWSKELLLIILLVFILSFFWFLFEVIYHPKIKQKYWRYSIEDECIQIKSGGILFNRHRVIPLDKVYYVDKTENILLSRYELNHIKIGTLANIHEIPAIPKNEADKLHSMLNSSIKKQTL